ncbi:MAG: molybdenum cofactor cytidylyltransferase, partial [Sulfurimonas sp.]
LIMLCDQPLIPLEHFKKLIEKSDRSENTIICSKYKNKNAVPTIFPKIYFKNLEQLSGDEGAKKLFKTNPLDFVVLEDKYSIDIDTREDWIKFNTKEPLADIY